MYNEFSFSDLEFLNVHCSYQIWGCIFFAPIKKEVIKIIYSEKLQKAINVAVKCHKKAFRKGKDVPYLVHPLTVGLILSQVTKNEDIIIAGILHDTVEDTEMTIKELEKEFGKNVSRMVNDVTEQDKSLSWEIRKKLALEHIKHMKKDSLLVKSADVLQNLTDQIEDYKIEGDKMFKRFNSPKDKQLKRYNNLILEFKKAWKENPLLPNLNVAVEWINKN